MSLRFISILGICIILIAAYCLSHHRSRVRWPLVAWGLILQLFLALLTLKTYPELMFQYAQALFTGIYTFAEYGAAFLFGSLCKNKDIVILNMGAVIIFVSSVMSILNYLRILPLVIYGLAFIMQRWLKTSGAETLAAGMFVFMGIEVITGLKTLIKRLTTSELFTVMTCFMATMAGSVMAVYVNIFGANPGFILAASLMNAPAAIIISKLMEPEIGVPETAGSLQWKLLLPPDKGIVEAAANGAIDGLKLTAAIAAILLAFVALVHMLNAVFGLVGTSFDQVGGYLFAPVAFIIGIPWQDCLHAGNLLAIKVVFNEWLAYSKLKEMIDAGLVSARTVMIMTYALASFANIGSLAILIGGITALAPERKQDTITLGVRSVISGFLASLLTAAVAGVLSFQ